MRTNTLDGISTAAMVDASALSALAVFPVISGMVMMLATVGATAAMFGALAELARRPASSRPLSDS